MNIDEITNKEEKLKLAMKIIDKVKDGQTIGFGSGTTSYIAATEIGKKVQAKNLNIIAVPTSKIIEEVCKKYNIKIGNLH